MKQLSPIFHVFLRCVLVDGLDDRPNSRRFFFRLTSLTALVSSRSILSFESTLSVHRSMSSRAGISHRLFTYLAYRNSRNFVAIRANLRNEGRTTASFSPNGAAALLVHLSLRCIDFRQCAGFTREFSNELFLVKQSQDISTNVRHDRSTVVREIMRMKRFCR